MDKRCCEDRAPCMDDRHHCEDRRSEELEFPRTNIYRCFDPRTCDNDCVLCRS